MRDIRHVHRTVAREIVHNVYISFYVHHSTCCFAQHICINVQSDFRCAFDFQSDDWEFSRRVKVFFCIPIGSEKTFQQNESSCDNDRRVLNNRQKLIHRAKTKSLRISVAIIAAFIICWTPYYVIMLIFMFTDADEKVSVFCFLNQVMRVS